jgi:hypothetical protein
MSTAQKATSKKTPALQAPLAAMQNATPATSAGNKTMEFATQQLSAPVAPAPVQTVAIDQNTPEFQAALAAALANRVALVKVAKEQKPARAPLAQQNGEKRPSANTIGGRIWARIDAISAANKMPATIAQVKADPELAADLVVNLTSIYARWRKFNGITKATVTVETKQDDGATSDVTESNVL